MGEINKKIIKVDSIGEIDASHLSGMKEKIDKGAEKFWAKRGMNDATHAYKYGSKAAKIKKTK
jgi:hypothetical protein